MDPSSCLICEYECWLAVEHLRRIVFIIIVNVFVPMMLHLHCIYNT